MCWWRFHLLWRFQAAFAGLLSFPCLGYVWAALRVVWVGALPCWGVFGWFPFACGWAVISALRAAREHTLCGVWLPGVVALVAYAVSGHPVTVLDAGAVAGFPCFWWGVLLIASQCARATVCLSLAACCVARCWFVAVCVVWLILYGVRFVSALALPVMRFMPVCASVRLTATVIVAYSLLCNGRFQRFALFTGMPVVFVSVSYCHKGWWGESGVRGRWRLVARRTT